MVRKAKVGTSRVITTTETRAMLMGKKRWASAEYNYKCGEAGGMLSEKQRWTPTENNNHHGETKET